MEHKHRYDAQGRQLCCTQTEKIYNQAGAEDLIGKAPASSQGHDHSHDEDGHDHSTAGASQMQLFLPALISFILLIAAIAMDNWIAQSWFKDWVRTGWYILAYLPVGFPVIRDALKSIAKGEIFSEFLLMSIATIGAFGITPRL